MIKWTKFKEHRCVAVVSSSPPGARSRRWTYCCILYSRALHGRAVLGSWVAGTFSVPECSSNAGVCMRCTEQDGDSTLPPEKKILWFSRVLRPRAVHSRRFRPISPDSWAAACTDRPLRGLAQAIRVPLEHNSAGGIYTSSGCCCQGVRYGWPSQSSCRCQALIAWPH